MSRHSYSRYHSWHCECLQCHDSTPSISVLIGAAMVAKGAASRKGKPMPQIESE